VVLFDSVTRQDVAFEEAAIHLVTARTGPPLLLVPGYPWATDMHGQGLPGGRVLPEEALTEMAAAS
jgi:hypothetical protein